MQNQQWIFSGESFTNKFALVVPSFSFKVHKQDLVVYPAQ